jgi:hypothetical protein
LRRGLEPAEHAAAPAAVSPATSLAVAAPTPHDAAPPRFTPIREKLPPLAVATDKKIEPAAIDDNLPQSIPIQETPVVADPKPNLKPIQARPQGPAAKTTPPSERKKFDKRCAPIDERIQLGDSISEQERAFYAENCQ